MEKANFNLKFYKKTKSAKYRWQDECINLSEELGINKGLLFKCWSIGGYPLLDKIKGDIKENFPKTPIAYILFMIKTWQKPKEQKPKIYYNPTFNLKDVETGKIIYLNNTIEISFDPVKYEII